MKNFTMLSLVFIMGFFSCSDNDDKSYTPNESIIHSWTLIKSTGTIAGITHEFPYGTIVWTFNSNNTVTIENNNATENLQSGMPSGTYSFVINPNQASASCEKKITIKEKKLNEYENKNYSPNINFQFLADTVIFYIRSDNLSQFSL